MFQWDEAFPQNHLLSAMPYVAFEALRPSLEAVILPLDSVLSTANTPIPYVHFLYDGIASVREGSVLGLLGREGLSGEGVIRGATQSGADTVMKVAGSSLRVSVVELHKVMDHCEPLRAFLQKYADFRAAERVEEASAALRHTPLERTARRLLMCHDRVDGDLLPLSRSFLQALVGGPATVFAESLQRLVLNQSIRSTPGWMEIRSRDRLTRVAGASYGTLEARYESLLGPFR